MHPVPVAIALEKEVFRVLGGFVAARKAPALPTADIADTVVLTMSNAVIASMYDSEKRWSSEKVFRRMESCGMLEQFIRCSTVPQPGDHLSVSKAYEELMMCVSFLKKKFKTGEPCGDVVLRIMDGTDGHG